MRKLFGSSSVSPRASPLIQEISKQSHRGLGADIDRLHERDNIRCQKLFTTEMPSATAGSLPIKEKLTSTSRCLQTLSSRLMKLVALWKDDPGQHEAHCS